MTLLDARVTRRLAASDAVNDLGPADLRPTLKHVSDVT